MNKVSTDLNQVRDDSHDNEPESREDHSTIISSAQPGDGEAFNALIEPHLYRIYQVAMQITRNHADAEDACQESILKAFVHLRSFKGTAQFSTWLTRITINQGLITIRKLQTQARRQVSENDLFELPLVREIRDLSSISNPEALCAQGERRALLWSAINQLETNSRMTVCQIGLEERETTEAAEEAHLSPSGVRSRLQRALRKLLTVLGNRLHCRGEQAQGLA